MRRVKKVRRVKKGRRVENTRRVTTKCGESTQEWWHLYATILHQAAPTIMNTGMQHTAMLIINSEQHPCLVSSDLVALWQSLENRRRNDRLFLFYKGLHGLSAIPCNLKYTHHWPSQWSTAFGQCMVTQWSPWSVTQWHSDGIQTSRFSGEWPFPEGSGCHCLLGKAILRKSEKLFNIHEVATSQSWALGYFEFAAPFSLQGATAHWRCAANAPTLMNIKRLWNV